ncbi:unnamed protein product [Clavelina lepadiformis]|uniref:Reverse transcriptase n=1 Tax=Clavelina lepadiformis TaxID=159417 RepID=A0ABP0FY81_CLALP
MNWIDTRQARPWRRACHSRKQYDQLFTVADDLVLLASFEPDLQHALDRCASVCNQSGIKISIKQLRMNQERLTNEVILATPTGKRPTGRPRTKLDNYITDMAWSRLRTPFGRTDRRSERSPTVPGAPRAAAPTTHLRG